MTCRVARLMPNRTQMMTVFCCKCGSSDRDMILISRTFGPYLCPSCAQLMTSCGEGKE